MNGEWKSLTLGECATFQSGGTPSKKRADFWAGDIPWVSAKDLKIFRLHDAEDHVTEEAVKAGSRLAPAGSIFLLVRGMTLHNDVPICVAMRDMAFNQDLKALIPKSGVDGSFLTYWLLANKPALLASVDSAGHGTGRLNTDTLKAMEVSIPPLAEQKRIAHILGTLDDKIELNRRMNATLEAMARALFQSWFVDFDPVRRNAEGGDSRPEDALFPDSFEDSGIGEIPKGWRIGKVTDLTAFSRAAVNPAASPEELFHHYSLPAFDDGRTPKIEAGSDIKSIKLVVPSNSVLLSKLNPHIPRIWFPEIDPASRSVCSTEFLVACPQSSATREYLFSLFTSTRFSSAYATLVTGTTGSHQRINAEAVQNLNLVIPPEKLVADFTGVTQPIFSRINRNISESSTLATLRDTLLPNLLNGEVDASNKN